LGGGGGRGGCGWGGGGAGGGALGRGGGGGASASRYFGHRADVSSVGCAAQAEQAAQGHTTVGGGKDRGSWGA